MFYAIDIFTYESFLKPLQENAKLDKSFIQSVANAGVSPDISTFKDHKTRQQVAQEVVDNTWKLDTCKTCIFHTNKKNNWKGLFAGLEIDQSTITDNGSVIIWPQMWHFYLNFLSF